VLTPRQKAQQSQRNRIAGEALQRTTVRTGLPPGWTAVTLHAYTDGKQVVVTDHGSITWEGRGEVEDDHDCDAMGCGWEHVLARFQLPQPVPARETTHQEEGR
jgi:hypothetical protein